MESKCALGPNGPLAPTLSLYRILANFGASRRLNRLLDSYRPSLDAAKSPKAEYEADKDALGVDSGVGHGNFVSHFNASSLTCMPYTHPYTGRRRWLKCKDDPLRGVKKKNKKKSAQGHHKSRYKQSFAGVLHERKRLTCSNLKGKNWLRGPDSSNEIQQRSSVIARSFDVDQIPAIALFNSQKRKCLAHLRDDDFYCIEKLVEGANTSVKHALDEMINGTVTALDFRTCVYNLVVGNVVEGSNTCTLGIVKDRRKLEEVQEQLDRLIVDLDNELSSLYCARCLLDGAGDLLSCEDQKLDNTGRRKSTKSGRSVYYTATVDSPKSYNEQLLDTEVNNEVHVNVPITSPCIALYDSLLHTFGHAYTTIKPFENRSLSKSLPQANVAAFSADKEQEETLVPVPHRAPSWIMDFDYMSTVTKNNLERSLETTFEFISDLCQVAIAEVRIPKPEWNENTEYNCLNGYCCARCCTCKEASQVDAFQSKPINVENCLKFEMETALAKVDLHRALLGNCSCFCKCHSDGVPLVKRAIESFTNTLLFPPLQAVSWIPVDTNDLNVDFNNEEQLTVTQERVVLRLKTDALPLELKSKLPFTCRLALKYCKGATHWDTSGNIHESASCISGATATQSMDIDDSTSGGPSKQNSIENDYSVDVDVSMPKPLIKDFQYLDNFGFWDALDILKQQNHHLHKASRRYPQVLGNLYDPFEIDINHVPEEALVLGPDDFVVDPKCESFVEVALYLPYVPGNLVPWTIESVPASKYLLTSYHRPGAGVMAMQAQSVRKRRKTVEQTLVETLDKLNILPASVISCSQVMQERIKMRNHLLHAEIDEFRKYKRAWYQYIAEFERKQLEQKNGIDEFAWGILPVRAMDMPDQFVPLPAGFMINDIDAPYTMSGFTSPHQVRGYGIFDMAQVKYRFSRCAQSAQQQAAGVNITTTARTSGHATRKRQNRIANLDDDSLLESAIGGVADPPVASIAEIKKNEHILSSFNNLTGPNLRWMDTCMDTMNEGYFCNRDEFLSYPVYCATACPEYGIYKLDKLVSCDYMKAIPPEKLEQEETLHRLAQMWTRTEVAIFIEKYLMYPKNFNKIAQFIDTKSCGDVVQFYYRFKYRLRLKERLYDLNRDTLPPPLLLPTGALNTIKDFCGTKDTSRFLRRELHVQGALESIFYDCGTDALVDFTARNMLGMTCISDYMLRGGRLDSGSGNYEVQLRQHRNRVSSALDFQKNLENARQGYILPFGINCILVAGKTRLHKHDQETETRDPLKGGSCLLIEKEQGESVTNGALAVALNVEGLIKASGRNTRGLLSILQKVRYQGSISYSRPQINHHRPLKSFAEKVRQPKKRKHRHHHYR